VNARSLRRLRQTVSLRRIQCSVAILTNQPKRLTVGADLDDWLGPGPGAGPGSTFIGYSKAVERASAALGGVELQRLATPQVEAFYAELRTRGNELIGGPLGTRERLYLKTFAMQRHLREDVPFADQVEPGYSFWSRFGCKSTGLALCF
jgi:hypothetical protein